MNGILVREDDEEASYDFAITGKSFAVLRRYFPMTLEKILLNGSVYARMSPDQKAQLIECLSSIGYCVGMCGDGANDCSALKAGNYF
jgi:cation-transporting ATPase 13A2